MFTKSSVYDNKCTHIKTSSIIFMHRYGSQRHAMHTRLLEKNNEEEEEEKK